MNKIRSLINHKSLFVDHIGMVLLLVWRRFRNEAFCGYDGALDLTASIRFEKIYRSVFFIRYSGFISTGFCLSNLSNSIQSGYHPLPSLETFTSVRLDYYPKIKFKEIDSWTVFYRKGAGLTKYKNQSISIYAYDRIAKQPK